ncbi:MAG: hypothetical protein C0425_01675 [Chlorobiaceae bacterium]|nr:hypothetical protein [Chlorobiaceae bacterium]MBA4309028.1 hypothetical protein [Chlorobiaceae bacterium]
MKQFLSEINISANPDEEFFLKIPEQRGMVNELMKNGIIVSYALSFDRTKLWIIFNAENKVEVMTAIDSFPLREYMDFEIFELMFHENVMTKLIQFSLN